MNKIVEELGDGIFLEIPEALNESYQARLNRKYPPATRESSQYIPGETPDSYLARLLELYGSENQKNYLTALAKVGRLTALGGMTIQNIAKGVPLSPIMEETYPLERNLHIKDKGMEDKTLWYLNASPAIAADTIRACNLSAHSLHNAEITIIKSAREEVSAVLLENKKVEGVDLPGQVALGIGNLKLLLAEKVMGRDQFKQFVEKEIENIITRDSLGLLTNLSAESFTRISQAVSGPVRPSKMLAESSYSAVLALDNLDIWPTVGTQILESYAQNAVVR